MEKNWRNIEPKKTKQITKRICVCIIMLLNATVLNYYQKWIHKVQVFNALCYWCSWNERCTRRESTHHHSMYDCFKMLFVLNCIVCVYGICVYWFEAYCCYCWLHISRVYYSSDLIFNRNHWHEEWIERMTET